MSDLLVEADSVSRFVHKKVDELTRFDRSRVIEMLRVLTELMRDMFSGNRYAQAKVMEVIQRHLVDPDEDECALVAYEEYAALGVEGKQATSLVRVVVQLLAETSSEAALSLINRILKLIESRNEAPLFHYLVGLMSDQSGIANVIKKLSSTHLEAILIFMFQMFE